MQHAAATANIDQSHSRNYTELPREQTLLMEESKGGDVTSSDFLAGLGISAMNQSKNMQGRMSV